MNPSLSDEVIAHHRTSGEDQSLSRHLLEVASLAGTFAGKIGLPTAGELVGLLHDLGKYSSAFQNYLKSAVGYLEQDKDDDFIDPQRMKGKIDHSTAGAQTIFREFKQRGQIDRIAGEILAVCICSHHSGLIDCLGSDGSDLLTKRLEKADAFTHLLEAWNRAESTVLSRYKYLTGSQSVSSEIHRIINNLCRKPESETIIRFKVGLLARFLFSCLIDADRISTADFEYPNRGKHRLLGQYEDWLVLSRRLEYHLSSLSVDSRINQLRRTISDHCLASAERERGIFTLTVPTGGGKTLASLPCAMLSSTGWIA